MGVQRVIALVLAARCGRMAARAFLGAAIAWSVPMSPGPSAEVARDVTWDELLPVEPPLPDPFPGLTQDQRNEVEILTLLRDLQARGIVTPEDPEAEDEAELTALLAANGFDVDALVAAQVKLNAEIERRNEAVNGDLDGQMIRMPGYALPLEYVKTGVKEFLLVPFVGACIHVPPPPPNQMVFVRLGETFTADDLYTPVWVTGRMTVQRSTQALSYVDGQSDITTGYVLDGIEVDPYEE
jgi:hypothetical protein